MKELAAADAVHNLNEAPASTTNLGIAVSDTMLHVRRLVFNDDSSAKDTMVATGGYNSNSSRESDRRNATSLNPTADPSLATAKSKSWPTTRASIANITGTATATRTFQPNNASGIRSGKAFAPHYCCKAMDIRYQPWEEFLANFDSYDSSGGKIISNEE